VPFQRRISVLQPRQVPARWSVYPTAKALPADVAATPLRKFSGAGAGLGTRFHVVPFQRTIRVFAPKRVVPTAQALWADVAATAAKSPDAWTGLGTRFHTVPFQRTIRVLLPAEPTAQALRADKTATPLKLPGVLNEATVPAGAVRTVPAALAPAKPDAITATPAPAVHNARIMWMLISSYPSPKPTRPRSDVDDPSPWR